MTDNWIHTVIDTTKRPQSCVIDASIKLQQEYDQYQQPMTTLHASHRICNNNSNQQFHYR